MLNSEWFIIQDGSIVPERIYNLFKDNLEIGDISNTKNGYISKFVGFIFCNDKILISFPKHYFSYGKLFEYQPIKKELQPTLYTDIRILFKVIQKAAVKKSEKTIGAREELNSNYPFQYFFEVYNYFLKYGLYTNEQEIRQMGYTGKIDWKKTLLKSPTVVSKGNLLYMPFVIKKKIYEHVFISKCMAYVIDSTSTFMSAFIDFKRTDLDIKDINWANKSKIISQLRDIKQSIFKDKQKKLITSLINFFENEYQGNDTIKLKTWSFDLIWEDMIELYLNNYFERINEHGYIEFSNTKNIKRRNFEKKRFFPDILKEKGRRLEPDYYLIEDNVRYIFDGKYYEEVKELNYKQVAYYFLLKHHEGIKKEVGDEIVVTPLLTHNILILPTDMEQNDKKNYKVHFDLNTEFNRDETELKIKEQYCNTKDVMKAYI